MNVGPGRKKLLLSLVTFFVLITHSAFSQTTIDEMKAFQDSNYLQIDQINVPEGLNKIENQIRENVIDVIIHSKTHQPIFAQKRPEGYSASYKKFHGLDITINPIGGDADFYSLQLFYYNWTTNKFDKKLTRKISKYNVLNELRFSTYELLLGKKWVTDNKDKIEQRNFDRIQAVKEVIDEQEKNKKKKLKKEALKKKLAEEELENENTKKQKKDLLKREKREKELREQLQGEGLIEEERLQKDRQKQHEKDQSIDDVALEKLKIQEQLEDKAATKKTISAKKNDKKNEPESDVTESPSSDSTTPAGPADPPVPKTSELHGFVNYFQESAQFKGLIYAETSLKYIGAGATFTLERQTSLPTGYRFKLQAGMPIFKEDYTFPMYRSIETEMFARIFGHLKVFGGLDYIPVYFVGLPLAGEGLQVYENDFAWAKIGASMEGVLFDKRSEIRFAYLQSLISKSNQKDTFSGQKIIATLFFQIFNNHGAEFSYSSMNVTGSGDLSSRKVGLSYTYKFEN